MPPPCTEHLWDAAAEEKSWRQSAASARRGQDMLEHKPGATTSDFYVLCLSELDAVNCFARSECFVSRAAFVAELRRLLVEPTAPSRPVPSVEAYQHAQKFWLEFVIKKYDVAS